MSEFFEFLFCLILTSVTGIVTLFLCVLSAHKEEIYKELSEDDHD